MHKLTATLGSMLAACLTAGSASSAPITLGFEAEIDRIAPGVPYESGVDSAVGDVISGTFTFDPQAREDDRIQLVTTQPYAAELRINGTTLRTDAYQAEAANNSPISDFPPASVVDSVTVAGDGLVVVRSVGQTFVNPDASFFRMRLFGEADTFEPARLPAAVEQWNQLSLRRQLTVSLHGSQGGVVGFQATVRQFRVVPEPTSHLLAALSFVARLARWNRGCE